MALMKVLSQNMNAPYLSLPPLHVLVVDIVDQPRVLHWVFTDNSATPGLTKNNKIVSVTDGKSVTKFTLFEDLSSKVKVGGSYIVKSYELRGQSPSVSLLISKRTLFFRARTLSVDEGLMDAARDLLHPKSAVTPLNECHNIQGFVTVQGEVVELSALKKIAVGKEEVPFRTLVLQQENTQVPLSLWREAAVFNVSIGGTVTITHARHGKAEYGLRLQTTGYTKMEVVVSESMTKTEIVGVMDTDKRGILKVLFGNGNTAEIEEELWAPFEEDLQKADNLVVDLEKVGSRITAIVRV